MATLIHRDDGRDRARHASLEQLLSQQDTILRGHEQILREGVGFSPVALTSHKIRKIEAALRRLAASDFGKCSDCRNAISGARLRAQPLTTLCGACQDRQDRTGAPWWPTSSRPAARRAQ